MRHSDFSVSVIVPTYNRTDLIGETLASIFRQTHSPAEVIVVDDGSIQDMPAAIGRFPVRYHRIENSGPSVARNAGVELATSPWIAFCDDDDLWLPGHLEAFAALFTNGGDYGFSNFRFLYPNGWANFTKFDELPPDFFAEPKQPLYPKLLTHAVVWPSAVVIRKSYMLALGGFDSRLSRLTTEDLDFTLRCNEFTRAVVSHAPLVGIRKHAGGLTANYMRVHLSDAFILAWARDHHESASAYADVIEREIAKRTRDALDIAFSLGRKDVVREHENVVTGDYRTAKFRTKVALSRLPFVPEVLLRALFGPEARRRDAASGQPAPTINRR
jgi:glycosyltransferase involved in cell wall biosynthesis